MSGVRTRDTNVRVIQDRALYKKKKLARLYLKLPGKKSLALA
jgi:hypothetical protein